MTDPPSSKKSHPLISLTVELIAALRLLGSRAQVLRGRVDGLRDVLIESDRKTQEKLTLIGNQVQNLSTDVRIALRLRDQVHEHEKRLRQLESASPQR